MNTKHTPGPWFVRKSEARENVFFVESENPEHVCGITTLEGSDKRNEANARLIATAPEMLKALEMIVADFEASGFTNPEELTWWDTACTAIAKAKGESK